MFSVARDREARRVGATRQRTLAVRSPICRLCVKIRFFANNFCSLSLVVVGDDRTLQEVGSARIMFGFRYYYVNTYYPDSFVRLFVQHRDSHSNLATADSAAVPRYRVAQAPQLAGGSILPRARRQASRSLRFVAGYFVWWYYFVHCLFAFCSIIGRHCVAYHVERFEVPVSSSTYLLPFLTNTTAHNPNSIESTIDNSMVEDIARCLAAQTGRTASRRRRRRPRHRRHRRRLQVVFFFFFFFFCFFFFCSPFKNDDPM
jgi:hypothetical protein